MSVYDDDYRDLVENARDAVRELLDASEHDSWSMLRHGYGDLRDALTRDDRERQRADQERERAAKVAAGADAKAQQYRERHAAQVAWQGLSRERREAAVLDVLGDEALTRTEITDRLDKKLRTPECGRNGVVYAGYVRPVLVRMVEARQLDRETELFKNKPRHRYSRRRELDGPIADLDRAFHDDESEDR